jgi:uncharacterized membrane protein YebE (DUF533 family)
MSNSTAVAATIGVSALGVLAYYGYQNMNGMKGDVNETTLYNELDGVTNNSAETTNFQDEAKKEVASAVAKARNAWGSFWKAEYASQEETDNVKVSLEESKSE